MKLNVFPTHTCGPIFSQDATGCQPMNEESVSADAAVSCRRPRACRLGHAAAALSYRSLRLLTFKRLHFEKKIGPQVRLEKSLRDHNLILIIGIAVVSPFGRYEKRGRYSHKLTSRAFYV